MNNDSDQYAVRSGTGVNLSDLCQLTPRDKREDVRVVYIKAGHQRELSTPCIPDTYC
jgi:hypothetical protein